MQGLADGYFVIPATLAHYLANSTFTNVTTDHDAFNEAESSVQARIDKLLTGKGSKTPRQLHRELGTLLWDEVGMARSEQGLRRALAKIPDLREEFWKNVSVPGTPTNLNKNLEYAGRVADYLEFAETLTLDALQRTESCGGHFREESQTPDGEALRDDENFSYVAAWEFQGVGKPPVPAQGAADVRVRQADAAELQVSRWPLAVGRWQNQLAADRQPRTAAAGSTTCAYS